MLVVPMLGEWWSVLRWSALWSVSQLTRRPMPVESIRCHRPSASPLALAAGSCRVGCGQREASLHHGMAHEIAHGIAHGMVWLTGWMARLTGLYGRWLMGGPAIQLSG